MENKNRIENFELLSGEYYRYQGREEDNEYICIGKCGGNTVFFEYLDTTGEVVNYVETIVENLPDIAYGYLMDVLSKHNGILVRIYYLPGETSSYEIYYNYNGNSSEVFYLVDWMQEHNDFANMQYKYTQVIDGHQTCVE